jgi:integrase
VEPRRRTENGVYYVRIDGKRVSLGTRDKKAAILATRELERRKADPSYAKAHGVTLEDACDAFLREAPIAGNRAKPPAAATLEMWRLHCGHFVGVWGHDAALASIDAAAVERYIAQRRAELIPGKRADRPRVSAATVDKELSTLRKVLAAAHRRGEFHRDPDTLMPARQPSGKRLTRALTWEQVPRLLDAWGAREDRAATCAFIVGLGADKAALRTARSADFDFARGVVLVRGTKTERRYAEVPIVPPFGALVRRAHAYLLTREAQGLVGFPEWLRGNASRDLAAACVRAELPRVTLRDLRRTCGQILRARGVAPHLIGAVLRHTDGRMAELHYATLKAEDTGELVRAAMVAARPETTHSHAQCVGNGEFSACCG